ncbi:MAG: DUF418 domain-containing protein [Nitriliruptoraceae bacterium]
MDPRGLRPTAEVEREPVLDVLRGFALLGILVINIAVMRGADVHRLFAGQELQPTDGIDRTVGALASWLFAGKFIASFALLFGVGAGLLAERALARGRAPRALLASRYAWLMVFGLAHMVLLFPGDILFVYGITGLILLAFVRVGPATALRWGVGLVVAVAALVAMAAATAPAGGGAVVGWPATRGDQAIEAFRDGSYLDILGANAWQALVLQLGQLGAVPWLLGLFLIGFATARAGIATDLAAHRPLLRRLAVLGLGLGLPLGAVLAPLDPLPLVLGTAGTSLGGIWPILIAVAQQLGAPLLAVGYLAGLGLVSLRWGPLRPLAAVGRMALTGYLLQSLLALVVFGGFDRYDRMGPGGSMVIVLGVWSVLLVVCPLWLRWFRFGPAEWLWRTLTYGSVQPLRRAR